MDGQMDENVEDKEEHMDGQMDENVEENKEEHKEGQMEEHMEENMEEHMDGQIDENVEENKEELKEENKEELKDEIMEGLEQNEPYIDDEAPGQNNEELMDIDLNEDSSNSGDQHLTKTLQEKEDYLEVNYLLNEETKKNK